jgi:DNA-binding NtrC family response regulator
LTERNGKEEPGREPTGVIRGGKETIFLVEDDEAILELGKTILENLGYKVVAARTPNQAVEQVEKYKGDISLLITDVVMPEMNGRELSDRVTAMRPGVKCLYMSGYPADGITKESVLDDRVSFIQKPFKIEEFAGAVRNVLDQK